MFNNKTGQKKVEIEGFTLIEVVVALSLFLFIIGGIIQFSVSSIKASQKSQAMQKAVDNARYTMDNLTKKVRTSSNIKLTGSGDTELFFIDNLTSAKYCYKFSNDIMSEATYELQIDVDGFPNEEAYNAIQECADFGDSDFTPVIGGSSEKIKISGKFETMETDVKTNSPQRGFVRIIVAIDYNENSSLESSSSVHIQSGVSLVDYGREEGIF